MMMTKEELIEAAYEMTGGSLSNLSVNQIQRLMTITQHVTDLCLSELDARDELTFDRDTGALIIPYMCNYSVDTPLLG